MFTNNNVICCGTGTVLFPCGRLRWPHIRDAPRYNLVNVHVQEAGE